MTATTGEKQSGTEKQIAAWLPPELSAKRNDLLFAIVELVISHYQIINYYLFLQAKQHFMKHLLLLLTIFALLSSVQAQKDTNDFVTTWRTTLSTPTSPSTNDSSVHINIDTTRVYNYDVDWDNDGVFDNLGVTKAITHQYPDTGTYTIRIRGQFPRIVFGFDIWYNNVPIISRINDSEKLLTIDQWGNTAWEDLYFAFSGCYNMTYNATDVPNLSSGPRLGGMFYFCRKFNGAIGNWDVSRVKVMDHMFEVCDFF